MDHNEYSQLQEIQKRGTSLFPIGYYINSHAAPGTVLHGHWHTEWQWIYIIRGDGIFTIGDARYHAKAGDGIFVNAGQFHFGISENSEGCTLMSVVFEPDAFYGVPGMVNEYYRNIKCGRFLPHSFYAADSDCGKEVSAQLERIYRCFLSRNYGYEIGIHAALLTLLSIILENRLYTEGTPKDSNLTSRMAAAVNSTIEYIHENYTHKISLQDMADRVSMSKQSLCRLFKHSTGTTVVDYLNTYRVYQACHMLETTGAPVNVIAKECGFENTSYFIKLFKKYKNTTPAKYFEKQG
ncbi:MAG: AraC family transcriptional regulator [Lachnospiraceae bacterium]|nr:AraC family transcriptional regulator [Lachnospiraceae bacterium]